LVRGIDLGTLVVEGAAMMNSMGFGMGFFGLMTMLIFWGGLLTASRGCQFDNYSTGTRS
jgi:hypothetical protein